MKKTFIGLMFLFSSLFTVSANAKVVLISFDGSAILSMWQDTLDFAKTNSVKFTYFISAPYFVSRSECKDHPYWAEKEIGEPYCKIRDDLWFNGTTRRFNYLNRAVKEGHEIASHLCGHYFGDKWTREQWRKEFEWFKWAIGHNGKFDVNQITGCRAPNLAQNKDYFEVLKEYGFTYDSSLVYNRIAQFTKDEIPIKQIYSVKTEKLTLPFDFNFEFERNKPYPMTMEEVFYKSLCNEYLSEGDFPVEICLHFKEFPEQSYYKAMKRFVLFAKQHGARFLTYKEYSKELKK